MSYEKPDGYSKEFLNLIDYGLKILPKNRPQSISNWEDSYLVRKKLFSLPDLSFFKFKRSDNFLLNIFRGGFILSSVVAFFAIGSMIFPNLLINSDSKISYPDITKIRRDSNFEKPFNSKVATFRNKRVETKSFSISKSPWKTLNISESFDFNNNYTHLFFQSDAPFRIRYKDTLPILVKKTIKYELSKVGMFIDIKSTNAKGSKVTVVASRK